MKTIAIAWEWAVRNQALLFGLLYCVLNVLKRPHPAALPPGPWRVLWTIVDRLCVLTASRMPGSWKLLLALSPIPEEPAGAPDVRGPGGAPPAPGAPQDKPAEPPYDGRASGVREAPKPPRE